MVESKNEKGHRMNNVDCENLGEKKAMNRRNPSTDKIILI